MIQIGNIDDCPKNVKRIKHLRPTCTRALHPGDKTEVQQKNKIHQKQLHRIVITTHGKILLNGPVNDVSLSHENLITVTTLLWNNTLHQNVKHMWTG